MKRKFILGVCAMNTKVESTPMKSILKLLEDSGDFIINIFPEQMILEEDVINWPIVECLIAFYSRNFPLEKAIEYVKMYNPIILNDLEKERIIRSRIEIYRELQACRIPHPNYIIVDHILVKKGIYKFEEQYDYIIYNGIRLNKPFIEKPIDSDDHNNWIYYPLNSGGGCKKLFRKNGDRSSNYYPEIHNVRRDSIYIYQEFVSNFGTDIKVYSVGPLFAHAESRKSPTLDGKVDRYPDGKEIRYPVILTGKEKIIAYRIVDHFKQLVCGFDILRTFDGPYVCDVNGWSFVKRNYKYLIDCSNILRIILLLKLQKKFNIIIPNLVQERQVDEIIKKTFADVKSYHKEELCSVVVIMRHADRKPKNKLKFYTKNSYIINYFKGNPGVEIKLKSPEELSKLNNTVDLILNELQSKINTYNQSNMKNNVKSSVGTVNNVESSVNNMKNTAGTVNNMKNVEEVDIKMLMNEFENFKELKKMLDKGYEFSGINRKVQLKPQFINIPINSVTVTGPPDSSTKATEGTEVTSTNNSTNSTNSTKVNTNTNNTTKDHTGASTVTEGKGANFMPMECTTTNIKEPSNINIESYSNTPTNTTHNHTTHNHTTTNHITPTNTTSTDTPINTITSSPNPITTPITNNNKDRINLLDKKLDSVLIVAKWGGDLTEVGKLQAEDLGRRFRETLYPADCSGLIRLHSTFRHDFKIFSSDEGRCQITSASFTKGILELEGDLTPILVTMTIRNKRAYELLNDTTISKQRTRCKMLLNQLISTFGTKLYTQILKQLTEYDRYYYHKAIQDSEYKLQDFPQLYNLIIKYIKNIKNELIWNSLYSYQYNFFINKLNNIINRWYNLLNKFASNTVLAHTDSNGPDINTTTNSTTNPLTNSSSTDPSTVGASTVTEGNSTIQIAAPGKGADFTAMECTMGKGANFTAMECTMGKGANSTLMECTSGKGANSMPMECTSEKISNEIAAVTNSGESGTFIEGVSGSEEGVDGEEVGKEDPLGADGEEVVGREPHTVTEEKIMKYDYTKLSDIVDNIRYDLIHLHYLLGHGLEIGFEIYNIVERLSSVISPCEYGVTPKEKLEIGVTIAWNLLQKILHDVTYHLLYTESIDDNSVTVTGPTATEGTDSNSTNNTKDISSTTGTIGASTVTERKGANSMVTECTTKDNNTKEAPFGAGAKDITGREPGTVTEDTVMELNEILKNDTSAASIAATSLLISNTYLNSKDIFDNGKCFIGGLKPSEMYLFNNKSQTELLYNSSVTVLGQTASNGPDSSSTVTNDTKCTSTTNSTTTDTVGASTVTEEKNSNEIAVVTKSGESSTFSEGEGVNNEGAPIGAVGEEIPLGADGEEVVGRGPHTVTEEKIINSYNLWSHENIEDKLTNNKGYHDLGYKYNKTMESKDIESELLNITNVLPYDGNPKIRSRYYVTSASHLFSVFNFFKYAHLLDDSFDTNSKQIENINDLHYLSHIVLRVWRSKSDKGYFNRLEILVSSGAKDGFGQNYQLLEKNAKNQKNNYKKYIQKLQSHKFSKFCNQCYIPRNLNNTNGTNSTTGTTGTGTVTDTTGTVGTTGVRVMNINVLDKYNLMYENIKEKKFKCYNCFLKEYKTLYNLQNFNTDNFTTADLGLSSPNIGLNTTDIGIGTPNNNLDKFNTDNNLDKFNTDNFSTLDIGFKPDIGLSTQDIGLNRGMNNGVKMVPPYCELNTLVTMNRNFGLDRLKDYIQKAYHNILLKN